jgi:ketosteroid isomerase-like protein
MRGLVSAERFYKYGRSRKAGIFLLFLAIIACLLVLFPDNLSNLINKRSRIEIRSVLSKFDRSYKEKDLEGLMALYSDSPEVIAIGSGDFRQRIGRKAIEAAYGREFSTSGMIKSVESRILSLTISGEIASLAADIYITSMRKNKMIRTAGKLTAVLKKVHGNWSFVQTHFSLAAPPE